MNFLVDAVICHVFRVVQIGKALQDQQWLFESLMVQVEEKRSAVENSAKQIEERLVFTHTVIKVQFLSNFAHKWWVREGLRHLPPFCLSRLHGVKIAHRKAENQIKMAKMIMMNELNKRANLLIEQLEVITFSFHLIILPATNLHAKNL